jgi:serine/threonine-protein kinase
VARRSEQPEPRPRVGKTPAESGGQITRDLQDSDLEGIESWERLESAIASWDRYRIDELIGSGGMGRVYRGWDPRLERHVAIKILTSAGPRQAERFLREAQSQARLEHDHICRVHEVGEVAGYPFIAMQLINGPTLADAAGELTTEQKALVVAKVAQAVHEAHRLGLVHRDLKPTNIMVELGSDGEWRPFVVDFGLVRQLEADGLTATGEVLGTPAYMAPEQAAGNQRDVDRRTDVYGLGAVLYALLSGEPPFQGESGVETLVKVLSEEVTPLRRLAPEVPADLATIVMACLEKPRRRRYQSARALAEDLERFLDGEPISARPISFIYRLTRKARKHRALVAVGSAALLVSMVLLGLWLQARWTAGRRADLALRFGQRVERVEGLLWRDYTLALHDVRPVRERVRGLLDQLAEEISSHGAAAEGPGGSALGRGYLALDDYETARSHLQQAWDSGYRTPDVAYALGVTLGELYQIEVGRTRRIGAAEQRKIQLQQLEKTLLEPAVACLQASEGVELASPRYLAALLAYYSGDYDQAVQQARDAFAEVAWLYEAKVLEASVLMDQAADASLRGEHQVSRDAYTAAGSALQQAAAIAKADPAVHWRRCHLWHLVLEKEVWDLSAGQQGSYQCMLDSCSDLLVADPDHPHAHATIAAGHLDWGEQLLMTGGDPTLSVSQAIAAAEKSVKQGSEERYARRMLVSAYWLRGRYEIDTDRDPRQSFEAAIQEAEYVLKEDPRYSSVLNELGLVRLDLAAYQYQIGDDPRPMLRQSIEAFERSFDIDPDIAMIIINAGISYSVWVEYLIGLPDPDEDPQEIADRGVAYLQQGLAINPRNAFAHRTLGSIHLQLGKWQRDAGGNPRSELEAAVESLKQALEIRANDPLTHAYLVEALLVRARYELDSNRDPEPWLESAQRRVAQGLTVKPGDAELLRLAAEAQALQGSVGAAASR